MTVSEHDIIQAMIAVLIGPNQKKYFKDEKGVYTFDEKVKKAMRGPGRCARLAEVLLADMDDFLKPGGLKEEYASYVTVSPWAT
jgi:hypothetical protein